MNQCLVDNHNSLVSGNDVTVHAGDFSLAKYTKTQEIIRQLNGKHVFLRGDHDKWIGDKHYADIWKEKIEDIPVCVSHYAMRVWWLSHYNSWNLFGHSHGKLDGIGKQHDIGVDNNNYCPVSFDRLKEIMYNKPNNFNYINKENR